MTGLSLEQRLLARTAENSAVTSLHVDTPCWICNYSLFGSGYPQVNVEGVKWGAHRLAYTIWVGRVPLSMHILHSCDNKLCVNPGHLKVGTNLENREDSVKKGRVPKGIGHWTNYFPERISRGHGHSEIMLKVSPRGDRNGSRTHPEKVPRGVKHWRSKNFTGLEIEFIKHWRSRGHSQQSIADTFKTSQSFISGIVHDKNWACKKEIRND